MREFAASPRNQIFIDFLSCIGYWGCVGLVTAVHVFLIRRILYEKLLSKFFLWRCPCIVDIHENLYFVRIFASEA